MSNNSVYIISYKSKPIYVGQTSMKYPRKRYNAHISAARSILNSEGFSNNTKKKYKRVSINLQQFIAVKLDEEGSLDNFSFKVVRENLSDEKADDFERFFIEKHNTYEKGYNRTKGGKRDEHYHEDKRPPVFFYSNNSIKYCQDTDPIALGAIVEIYERRGLSKPEIVEKLGFQYKKAIETIGIDKPWAYKVI